MRRNEFNISDEKIIKELLDECEYGTLSLISQGKPYAVAVNFVFYDDCVYIHGSKEGRKVEAIKTNKNASFLVVKPYSFIPSYFSDTMAACPATQFFSSVFLEGSIKIVEDVDKKAEVLNALMTKLQSEGGYEEIEYKKPMYKKMLEKTAVFELKAKNITCKVKVGQNMNKAKKDKMIEKLERRDTSLDKKTIDLMKEMNE